jgi:hypothetical protein
MTPLKNTIVIARYREDIRWITQIPDEFEIFLYNKGDQIVDPAVRAKVHHLVDRPNVGRESETFLHHMANHRRADDDFTVFAQGDPFEHSPDFLHLLNDWRSWADVQPLTRQWKGHENVPPPLVLEEYDRTRPGLARIRPERFSLSTWGPLDFIDVGALGTSVDYRRIHGELPDGTNIASHFLNMCRLHDLADEAAEHALGIFCYGAIFAVRNHRLLNLTNRNLDIMLHMSKGAACYGYVLERMWLHFFGARFELPRLPGFALSSAESHAKAA